MNMILFTPKIFEYFKNDFIHFFKIKTSSKWYGMTYKKDAKKLKIAINKMIENNEYNSKLWSWFYE